MSNLSISMLPKSSQNYIFHAAVFLLCSGFLCSVNSFPAFSTVLEWDEHGDIKLNNGIETENAKSRSVTALAKRLRPVASPLASRQNFDNLSARQVRVRSLVQDVALKHSGHPAVRKAGLTTLQFTDLFDALIHRESGYNSKAVSSKGAKGLGQLMPAMMSDHGVTDPFNPTENLRASATYLTYLLSEFGSVELALAAYNAGPTRVRKLGRIPNIFETRKYIKWIFAKAQLGKPKLPPKVKQNPVSVSASETSNIQTVFQQPESEPPLSGERSVWEF